MVYILKFSRPLAGHAQYYVGCCTDKRFNTRLEEHLTGRGAAIVRACVERNIEVFPIAIFENVGYPFEKRIKNRKNTPRIVKQILQGKSLYGKTPVLMN